MPPACQRTTGVTPKAAPSRPREEAISLAQREVSPPSQAGRGLGAALVLVRLRCPRAPFGSFPRVGKNALNIRRCAREPCAPQDSKPNGPAWGKGTRIKGSPPLSFASFPQSEKITPAHSEKTFCFALQKPCRCCIMLPSAMKGPDDSPAGSERAKGARRAAVRSSIPARSRGQSTPPRPRERTQ